MATTTTTPRTLTQQLNDRKTLEFQRQLYDRAINSETITAGEHYLYFDGHSVVSRKAKPADAKVVDALMLRRWQNLTSCVHCGRIRAHLGNHPACCTVAKALCNQGTGSWSLRNGS